MAQWTGRWERHRQGGSPAAFALLALITLCISIWHLPPGLWSHPLLGPQADNGVCLQPLLSGGLSTSCMSEWAADLSARS